MVVHSLKTSQSPKTLKNCKPSPCEKSSVRAPHPQVGLSGRGNLRAHCIVSELPPWVVPHGWFCNLRVQSCFCSGIRVASGACRDSRVETLNSEAFNPQETTSSHQLSSESKSRNQQSQFVTQTLTSSQVYLQSEPKIRPCYQQ